MRLLLVVWRRERDSNPRYSLTRIHTFQACSFNHSDISPDTGKTRHSYINHPWCAAPASASCFGLALFRQPLTLAGLPARLNIHRWIDRCRGNRPSAIGNRERSLWERRNVATAAIGDSRDVPSLPQNLPPPDRRLPTPAQASWPIQSPAATLHFPASRVVPC